MGLPTVFALPCAFMTNQYALEHWNHPATFNEGRNCMRVGEIMEKFQERYDPANDTIQIYETRVRKLQDLLVGTPNDDNLRMRLGNGF